MKIDAMNPMWLDRDLRQRLMECIHRLRAGMTKKEVEAILGPHSGQKVRYKEPQYAWIGEGMMLRVQFFGPNLTLSKAMFDTPEKAEIIVPDTSSTQTAKKKRSRR